MMDTYTQSILPENIVALTKSTFALLQNPLRSRLNGALKIFTFFVSFQNKINFLVAQIESFNFNLKA